VDEQLTLRQHGMSDYAESKWDMPHVLLKMATEAVQLSVF
jgi:hypothetical protein